MASKAHMESARAGDLLLVIHEFSARSPDELTLHRGDRLELIERDDDFGDGWFLGKHLMSGVSGLFPEVYTTPAPRGIPPATTIRPPIPAMGAAAAASADRMSNGQDEAQAVAGAESTLKSMEQPPRTVGVRASDSALASQMQSVEPTSSASQRSSLPQVPTSGARLSSASSYGGSDSITSPVMNETLSVIEEHITDMHTPRCSPGRSLRPNDSASDHDGRMRHPLGNINGEETDEEENGKLTEAEVSSWSPARVADYLEDVGVEKMHCDVFREQEISGEVLLSMEQSSIFLKEFELGSVGRRLKTWHKVRQIQIAVGETKAARQRRASNYSAGGLYPDGRRRSVSTATELESQPSATASSTMLIVQSPQPLFQTGSETSRTVRPSAAEVRGLNHSRRHSSFDNLIVQESPSQLTAPVMAQSASPTGTSHKKKGSLDTGWTMSSNRRPSVSTGSASGRPLSTVTGNSGSTDTPADNFGLTNVTVVSAIDLDRGYFSGNEAEGRVRPSRNVLRKSRDVSSSASGAQHSRGTSFAAAFRRSTGSGSGSATHARGSSHDSTVGSVGALASPSKAHSSRFGPPNRSISGPEVRIGMATDYPPTVTRLEYGAGGHSIDAVAGSPSPKPAGSDRSSIDKKLPMLPVMPAPPPSRLSHRVVGLRAISDAVTGSEKTFASSPQDAPNTHRLIKDSPLDSPARTGSSTPSATSKSFEMDEADSGWGRKKSATTSSSGTTFTYSPTPPLPSARRKSKKATSAYTRGLLKRGPQAAIIDADYSGWMKKKSSNVMATWKPRLFVLKGRRLSYYYSDRDNEEKGLIDISNHRVLPANDERLVGLHATLTGATANPTNPYNGTTGSPAESGGMFIFKLVPPREGLSKAVNFTKPTVHYFAVDNLNQGRLWMGALMKATIDKDDTMRVVTTYNQPTISLAKARLTRQRPPALMGDDSSVYTSGKEDAAGEGEGGEGGSGSGLGLGVGLGIKTVAGAGSQLSVAASSGGSEMMDGRMMDVQDFLNNDIPSPTLDIHTA